MARKILKSAKGYYGARSRVYRRAAETLRRALAYAYRDRRARKREFRALWNIRINAATRLEEISYSQFIRGLKALNIGLDRKILADLAQSDLPAISHLIALMKEKNITKSSQTEKI